MKKVDDSSYEQIIFRISDILKMRILKLEENLHESYTALLFSKAPNSFLKKIGEETAELIIASTEGNQKRIIEEMADLWFHCLVALVYYKLKPEDVLIELANREGLSGLVEKNQRSRIN